MRIGYIRISSKDQLIDRQKNILEELGVEKYYIDIASGKNREARNELKEMLNFIREGDTVIVESISRFARNTRDLLELIDILNEKKVSFISHKEQVDTSTPMGKFILTVFGAMSELERNYILERQREGIESMPLNEEGKRVSIRTGKPIGRPKKTYPKNFTKVYETWKSGAITGRQAMELTKLKRTTFYKLVKEYENK